VDTEVRQFYSLKDLADEIDQKISEYKALADEYNQRLGAFLRGSKGKYGDQEWFKKLSGLQKGAKPTPSSDIWIGFHGLMLCADERGEAEMIFEVIDELKRKIDSLTDIKGAVKDLKKSGLGEKVLYIVHFRGGVPEKVVLHPQKDGEFAKKFQYVADFST